jgi:hypothetical protein
MTTSCRIILFVLAASTAASSSRASKRAFVTREPLAAKHDPFLQLLQLKDRTTRRSPSTKHRDEIELLLALRGGAGRDGDYNPYSTSTNSQDRYQEDWEPANPPYRPASAVPPRDPAYYDDRGLEPPNARNKQSSPSSYIPSILSRGNKKTGLLLLAAGAAVSMLGVTLFFNKTLMRVGNLLVLAGVPLTLGPTRTMGYFLQPRKTRATACLMAGIFLVFVGWPILGIALEVFGLLNLFGNMFPLFWAVVKQMPIVGNLLQPTRGGSRRRNENGAKRKAPAGYYDDTDDIDRRRREEEYY